MKTNIHFYDVFVPGGYPTYTYNPREELKLQEVLHSARCNLTKLMIVTGQTKAGKTVLVDKVYPHGTNIWVDGGTISNEEMFWETIVEQLNGYTENTLGYNENTQMSMAIANCVSGGIKLISGSSETTQSTSSGNQRSEIRSRKISNKVKAIEILKAEKTALVVDDFHYIPQAVQKNIIRALKAPIMEGVPAIFIAIPSRKFEVINIEREMTGRVEQIQMPDWTEDDLATIAIKGFSSLNVKVSDEVINRFAREAYGSPFLMQEFCRAYCKTVGIMEQQEETRKIENVVDYTTIFQNVAENSGRSMFRKLEMGPRQRSDRKERKLIDGTITDIYGLVMAALKNLKPTETIKYESLRAAIKEISKDEPPQRGEVSRILEKIAEISHTDTSSTPVIDWQKDDDLLTITDPFFAFYLRWAK